MGLIEGAIWFLPWLTEAWLWEKSINIVVGISTLYHWDLPKTFDDKGGWQKRDTANWFADYTDLIAKKFGDRLHSIATINELSIPPLRLITGLCAGNVLANLLTSRL